MADRPVARFRRVLVGAVVATTLVLSAVGPVAAVDPIEGIPLPEEPAAVQLAEIATEAQSFDLDGDGADELVAVVARDDAGGLAAIQAWSVEADGAVGPTNKVPLRRSASVDELLSGRGRLGIDRDDMIAMRLTEPAKFLVVRRDGSDVLLVAAMGTETDIDAPIPCCLTVWEVVLDDAGSLDLLLVADTQRHAVQVAAVDFDDDDTDELLVTEGLPTSSAGASLLRWDGVDRFGRAGFEVTSIAGCCFVADVADTDGLPGEEALLLSFPEDGTTSLHRLSVRASTIGIEAAELDEVETARALTLASGPAIVTASFSSQALTVWSWPAGGRPQQIARRVTGGQIAAVLGTGADTRIVIFADPSSGSILVVPGNLGGGSGPTATVSRDSRASIFASNGIQLSDSILPTPYFGVLPDGLPNAPDVFVFGGTRITPDPDPEGLIAAAPLALLPDTVPVARVGPDGGWTAIVSRTPDFAIFASGRPEAAEDMLTPTIAGPLHLASTASLLEVEDDLGRLTPTFMGVAPDVDHPPILMVGNEAVDVEIHGPPGTLVRWVIRSVEESASVAADGVARIRLMEPAGPDAPDGSGSNVGIQVVTPSGHAYSGSWRINVYRQPPDLGIRDQPSLVDFNPTLTGRTLPGSTLTINGIAVPIAGDGSFTVPVEVGILPTELRVVVTDPVGNRTERIITRVWPVDYRQLPFVPIAVLLTLAAGAILYLRKPDAKPGRGRPDDGATFEEIGG
jgi:hypothetical protein